jgi:hypothetical protein
MKSPKQFAESKCWMCNWSFGELAYIPSIKLPKIAFWTDRPFS